MPSTSGFYFIPKYGLTQNLTRDPPQPDLDPNPSQTGSGSGSVNQNLTRPDPTRSKCRVGFGLGFRSGPRVLVFCRILPLLQLDSAIIRPDLTLSRYSGIVNLRLVAWFSRKNVSKDAVEDKKNPERAGLEPYS